MRVDQYYQFVMGMPEATEGFPFGPDVAVFKVRAKMFATLNVDEPPYRTNLKCDPERAQDLRDTYAGIRPGYHMNKKHWNTIELDSDVPVRLIRELVEHSYELVVKTLPKAVQRDLGSPSE
ncbi:MAG: MmcQ/YjbR family DNA-binding protein [Rhodothermales bacterium]|nr:MmcQ/YjbR family DNA-binding protein [Rhodothermales bacterium]